MIVRGTLINRTLLRSEENVLFPILIPTSMEYFDEAFFKLEKQGRYYIVKEVVPLEVLV